jgi:hypothetical protein
MFCLGGLDSVWWSLLLTWGGKRISAGECDYRQSKQVNQDAPRPWDARAPATAKINAASIQIGVRRVNGPNPSRFEKYDMN